MDLVSILGLIVATFTNFSQMVGVAAFISALVNALKVFGVVKDGTAGQWFAGLDFGAIIALVLVQLFAPSVGVDVINVNAGLFATVILLILGYLASMGIGTVTNKALSNLRVPLIGKSFSRDKA